MRVIGRDGQPLALTLVLPLPESKRGGGVQPPPPPAYWQDDEGRRRPPGYTPFDYMTEAQFDAVAARLAPVLLELIAKGRARTDPPASPASPDSLSRTKSVAKEPVAKKAAKKAAARKPAARKPGVK